MPPAATTPASDPAGRPRGFSLDRVGWGYRELVADAVGDLYRRGLLGPGRPAVTEAFLGFLARADQGGPWDRVLARFLKALNTRTEWLLGDPALFSGVVALGRDLAAGRPQHGVAFFDLVGEGALGDTPDHARLALTLARRLQRLDGDLCLAFLRRYRPLAGRLGPDGLTRFAEEVATAFRRGRDLAFALVEGAGESARALLRRLDAGCSLHDVRRSLGAVLTALAGRPVELAEISRLPAPGPGGRTPGTACFRGTLYLPSRVHRCERWEQNRSWYTLAAAVAAGGFRFGGFSTVHGEARFPSLQGLAGDEPLALNALTLAEWRRLLVCCLRVWPGLETVHRFWLDADLAAAGSLVPEAAAHFLRGEADTPAFARLAALADRAKDVFDAAAGLRESGLPGGLGAACPELGRSLLPPLSFFPDGLFPAPGPQTQGGAAAVREEVGPGRPDGPACTASPAPSPAGQPRPGTDPVFVYDEWDREQSCYRHGHCRLREEVPEWSAPAELTAEVLAEARRVHRAFERLQPDAPRRERFLQDGDAVDADRLVHVLVERAARQAPRIDFYERPRIPRRDLAVLLLLDVSGSTAEATPGGERLLDVERDAAFILGDGLAAAGDRFAVCGFHSAGPKDCFFLVFKDFDESWPGPAAARLAAAVPGRNTRIGPALRHAGTRLRAVRCRQRLILVMTDGRPMDSGYDPATGYAYADVRRACEENRRHGIHTLGICTDSRQNAAMERMFPERRFVLLPSVRQLPRLLPRLYARLTC